MVVTDILDYDKRKVLVQVDGYLVFPIYKSEVAKYRLIKDAELSDAAYVDIVKVLLPKRVKLRAMELLKKRSYTRCGLKRKLLEARYPEEIVEEALDYVTSYGYLDDMQYAEEYIRCYCESRSRRRIIQDLSSKGVGAETVERAWQHYEAENRPVKEEAQIMELLRKKQFDPEQADYKERIRFMNFLYRKGYSMDSIRRCIGAGFTDEFCE